MAAADGAVEGRLVRGDAGRHRRPAVRHMPMARLRERRRPTTACQSTQLAVQRAKCDSIISTRVRPSLRVPHWLITRLIAAVLMGS